MIKSFNSKPADPVAESAMDLAKRLKDFEHLMRMLIVDFVKMHSERYLWVAKF